MLDRYITSLSARTEFAVVLALAFGWFIVVSLVIALFGNTAGYLSAMTDDSMYGLLIHELVMLVVIGWFLHRRRWAFERFGFTPTVTDTLIGLALVVALSLLLSLSWSLALAVAPGLAATYSVGEPVTGGVHLGTILAVSIVNPLYEELLVSGYVISALQVTRGFWFSVNVSVLIRLLYHLYQGAAGVLEIIPLGLVFAIWFARTGRLWPLVVAHAIFDLVGLAGFL